MIQQSDNMNSFLSQQLYAQVAGGSAGGAGVGTIQKEKSKTKLDDDDEQEKLDIMLDKKLNEFNQRSSVGMNQNLNTGMQFMSLMKSAGI